jgi:hypothetical protein
MNPTDEVMDIKKLPSPLFVLEHTIFFDALHESYGEDPAIYHSAAKDFFDYLAISKAYRQTPILGITTQEVQKCLEDRMEKDWRHKSFWIALKDLYYVFPFPIGDIEGKSTNERQSVVYLAKILTVIPSIVSVTEREIIVVSNTQDFKNKVFEILYPQVEQRKTKIKMDDLGFKVKNSLETIQFLEGRDKEIIDLVRQLKDKTPKASHGFKLPFIKA